MRTHRLCLLAVIAALHTDVAFGQHADIFVRVNDNTLGTYNLNEPNAPAQVFRGALGELGLPGFTDDPGYNSGELAPNSLLGYDVAGPLYYWDGMEYVEPPLNERLDILLSGTLLTSVTGTSGSQAGSFFTQASASGGVHRHLQYWVRDPNYSDEDPFNNPISPGAYALLLQLTSDVHAPSAPFAIVFNNGLDPNSFNQAEIAADDLLGGDGDACPGDYNDDGVVNVDDLLTVLGGFGVNFDVDDLLAVLGGFGTNC